MEILSFRCWCMFFQPPSSPPSYILFNSAPSPRANHSQPGSSLLLAHSRKPLSLSCARASLSLTSSSHHHLSQRRFSYSLSTLPPTHPVSPFLFVITLLLPRAFKLHLNLFSQLHIFLNNSCIYRYQGAWMGINRIAN